MQTVSLSRDFDADPDAVEALVEDVGAFTRAGGFDDVEVEGDLMRLRNGVGIATMELKLELLDTSEATLAYRQVEGIFDEMETQYSVEATETGTRITARTSYELDLALVGDLLDSTVIKRQRRREIEAQFDWLEPQLA
jgi:carbon monoxide dehydrogenase subunit G